jgi:hypothetical protein
LKRVTLRQSDGASVARSLLVVLIPFLCKLITDKAETPIVEAAAVVPVA